MSDSPQRKRKVAYGEAAPPAAEFSIEPVMYEGKIIAFRVSDPTGSIIRHREKIAEIIHEAFPGVSIEEVRNARIGYEEYRADIVLPNQEPE